MPQYWLFLPSLGNHHCASGSVTWTTVSLLGSIYVPTLNILLGSIAGDQNTLFTERIVRCLYYTRGTSKSRSKKRNEGKNGAVITKNYTSRDDVKMNTHGDLKIRVFGLYEWIFVRVILKLIVFLTNLIA